MSRNPIPAAQAIDVKAAEPAQITLGDLLLRETATGARGEKIGDYEPTFADRVDAAKAAAPYFAPKLAATELSTPNNECPVRELTDAELLAIVEGHARAATERSE